VTATTDWNAKTIAVLAPCSSKPSGVEVLRRCSKLPDTSGILDAVSHPTKDRRESRIRPRVHRVETRLGPEQLTQLTRDYQDGATTKQLRDAYHLNPASIRRLLIEAGVHRRGQPMTPDEIDLAVERYTAGMTMAQVGEELNRPLSTIQTALSKHGVATRSRHDHR
jgi:hypothetical protein